MLRSSSLGLALPWLGVEEVPRAEGKPEGSRSNSPQMKLEASDKASESAGCASPRRAAPELRVHAQVAVRGLGEARAAAALVAPGPSCCRLRPLPARRPPGLTPARAAHAFRPPLKGPVRSRRVLSLPRPSLRSRLSLGCGWRSLFSIPPFQGTVKAVRSYGVSFVAQRSMHNWSAKSTEIPRWEGLR